MVNVRPLQVDKKNVPDNIDESVERRATKQINGLRDLSCDTRLKRFHLPTHMLITTQNANLGCQIRHASNKPI